MAVINSRMLDQYASILRISLKSVYNFSIKNLTLVYICSNTKYNILYGSPHYFTKCVDYMFEHVNFKFK